MTTSLPKLPVPPLEQTLEKYKRTLLPILDDNGKRKLDEIIQKFGGEKGLGRKLQLYLLEKYRKSENWALNYWLDDKYFKNTNPLPVNSNSGIVLLPVKFTTSLDLARFSARIIDAALEHKGILDRKELPVEKTSPEPGQPLCMSQHYALLGSCRVPGKKGDLQFLPQNQKSQKEHVIVICRNQFYYISIETPDSGKLSEDEIRDQILYILNDASNLISPPPIGLLTGINRTLWAETRDSLCEDDTNRKNLELISSSLLIICLDEALPANFNCRSQIGGKGFNIGGRDVTNLGLQMIHGGGSIYNTANRWFDKTIQFIISEDGACGICFEHSSAEFVALIQLGEKLYSHASLPISSSLPSTNLSYLPTPKNLEWNLNIDDLKRLADAATSVDKLVNDLDFLVFRFLDYGKEFMKSCNVSPDVYIQLALQLSYFKLYGKLTATYESASTRRFRLGRVDCIRSGSPETLAWVSAMTQPKQVKKSGFSDEESDEIIMKLWKNAVEQQTTEIIANTLGHGIDVHLLSLREAAKETCPTAVEPLPELFTDESYLLANKYFLNQAAYHGDILGCLGPNEPEGYGVSYNPKEDLIIFCISCFSSCNLTSTSKFAQALEESLVAMKTLLTTKKKGCKCSSCIVS